MAICSVQEAVFARAHRCFTWQVVVLEAVVVDANKAARKEATHPESQPLIIWAVSHPASLSVRLPFCLSVCLHRQLAVYTTLVFCVMQAHQSFHWRAAWEKKGYIAVHMLDAGPVAWLKREGGNEGGRKGEAPVH